MARALSLLALLWLLAAGCGGEAPSAGSRGDGKVVFQVSGDPEELAVYRRLADVYEQRTGRAIQLVEVADREAHIAKLTTSFAARRPPDLFLVNYRNYGPFAARGVVEPVGPRLDRSSTLEREDYYEAPLDAFTTGRQLNCLAQNASSLVVYYNRDFLEAAGVPAPQPGWTYDEFLRSALRLRTEALTRKPEGSHHALGIDPGLVRLAPFIWSAGGELVDDEDAPTTWAFDSPEARRGLDRFLRLHREALVPTEAQAESKGLEERFFDGQLAMFMSSRREVPTFRQIEFFEWDVAAFPRAEEDAGILHADALCLAKGTDTDAAWAFVEFAGGPEGQRLLARGGRIVPSLKAVAESPDFLRPGVAPRSSQVFLDAIPKLRRLPNSRNWPRIEDAADLAFKRAFYSELTPPAALARIEAESAGQF